MRILVFDNYDSFTYNLVHLLAKLSTAKIDVYLNDEIGLEQAAGYDKIILSPGPGLPSEAGLLLPLIKEYASTKSILGVCLGHQAIAEAFGGKLLNLDSVFHGISTNCNVIGTGKLFMGLPSRFPVGRYHSWIVDEASLPGCLTVTAKDDNGYIMALQHHEFDIQGVQFHPESILTRDGEIIIRNWLQQ